MPYRVLESPMKFISKLFWIWRRFKSICFFFFFFLEHITRERRVSIFVGMFFARICTLPVGGNDFESFIKQEEEYESF